MKFSFLVALLVAIGFQMAEAQYSVCGNPTLGSTPCDIIKGTVPYVNATQRPLVDIGVAIHIVRYSDGSGGWEGDPQPAMNAVNAFFSPTS